MLITCHNCTTQWRIKDGLREPDTWSLCWKCDAVHLVEGHGWRMLSAEEVDKQPERRDVGRSLMASIRERLAALDIENPTMEQLGEAAKAVCEPQPVELAPSAHIDFNLAEDCFHCFLKDIFAKRVVAQHRIAAHGADPIQPGEDLVDIMRALAELSVEHAIDQSPKALVDHAVAAGNILRDEMLAAAQRRAQRYAAEADTRH